MIRCGGSRPSFSPRVARVLRARFRRRGARRGAPRLRRSSRAALPALARRHARAGALGVESGLVGGLSRATVLPARRRLRGSARSPGVLHDALGVGVVPRARLDRLPGAGADRVPGARSNSRKRLARPAGRLPRAHGVPPRTRRLATALAALVLAAALTAFWTWPLLLRLEHARALAWGEPPGISRLGWLLVILALLGLWRARGPAARVVARLPWAMLVVT